MLLFNLSSLKVILKKIGLQEIMRHIITRLQNDYSHWDDFSKVARHATNVTNGVIELMPVSDARYYACKYVNGHPKNPETGLLTVVGIGVLADTTTGYPLLLSEMTLSTAIRTAAMAACVAQYCANKNSSCLAIIGCGAQSEFQVAAHAAIFPLSKIYYYDIDEKAMQKFAKNISEFKHITASLVATNNVQDAVKNADIIITATTVIGNKPLLEIASIKNNVHVQAIGGDCPGKNEITSDLMQHAYKVIVEYPPQTYHEGESEQLNDKQKQSQVIPFYKLATAGDPQQDCFVEYKNKITIFDSVGFAIEDYSILAYWYDLCQKHGAGIDSDMIPKLNNPKDLWSSLKL